MGIDACIIMYVHMIGIKPIAVFAEARADMGHRMQAMKRGVVGGEPVGRGLWERREEHRLLSDGTVGRASAVGQRQLWQGRLVREFRCVMVPVQAVRTRHGAKQTCFELGGT